MVSELHILFPHIQAIDKEQRACFSIIYFQYVKICDPKAALFFLGIVLFLYVELQRIIVRSSGEIFNDHVGAYCIQCLGGACAMYPISIMIIAFNMLSSSRMPHSSTASHRLIVHIMYIYFLYLINSNMYVM